MDCPDDIADILLQILTDAIVTARWAGWRKNSEWAAIEASHVHNLPDVLRRYDPEKLVYYWDAERGSYIEQYTQLMRQGPTTFDRYWAALEPLMPQVRESLPPTSTYRAAMKEIVRAVAEEHMRSDE